MTRSTDFQRGVMASLEPAAHVCLSNYMFAELDYSVWAGLSPGERDAHRRLALAHQPSEMMGNLTTRQFFQRALRTGEHAYWAPELLGARLVHETGRFKRDESSAVALFLGRTIDLVCSFIGAKGHLRVMVDRSYRQIPWNRISFGYPGLAFHLVDFLSSEATWWATAKMTLRRTLKVALIWAVPCSHYGQFIDCATCDAEAMTLRSNRSMWRQILARRRERMADPKPGSPRLGAARRIFAAGPQNRGRSGTRGARVACATAIPWHRTAKARQT